MSRVEGRGPGAQGEASPAGSRPGPATEVISAERGPSLRRIRKLRITVLESPGAGEVGRAFEFAQDEVRVGSDDSADVTLADASVSREHVAIRLGADGWTVSDVGSTNGTFVGALRVHRITIDGKESLRLGKSVVCLEPLAETVEQELSPRPSFGRMLGASAPMREMFALLERASPSELTVLVEGETGTGKELAAEGIHEASGRPGAFIAVNCGAIPRELIESELFGHEKGAFTGAAREREGAFLAADRGTLFLDEVGELPLDMQAKLLRALERREVKPVGSDKARRVDVRIVAATNRALAREVAEGRFRQDLYYRLAVVVVRVPPLRTRMEDLRLLVDHVEDELARRRRALGLAPYARLGETAIAMLSRYDFPGNVRELRNIVERWAVLGETDRALVPAGAELLEPQGAASAPEEGGLPGSVLGLPYHEAKEAWVDRFERSYAEAILRRSGGNVSKAAREAGVDRRHLQRLMARFGIRASEA